MNREELLVHADALSRAGDPQGELIRVQCALVDDPGNPGLEERNRRVTSEILGAVPDGVFLQWSLGYVASVELVVLSKPEEAAEFLKKMLTGPIFAKLREVRLSPGQGTGQLLQSLSHLPASVQVLHLDLWRPRRQERPLALPDLAFIDGHPGLQTLRITASALRSFSAQLPALRELDLRCLHLHPFDLGSDLMRRLPRLESLTLQFGGPSSSDASVELAAALVERIPQSGLHHLQLRSASFGDAIIEPLSAWPGSVELESLVLFASRITDQGAALLGSRRANFPQLTTLAMRSNHLTAAGVALVTKAFPFADLADQEPPSRTPFGPPDETSLPS